MYLKHKIAHFEIVVTFLLLICKSICSNEDQGQFVPETDQNQNFAEPEEEHYVLETDLHKEFIEPKPVHYTYSPFHLTFLAKLERQIYDAMGQYEERLLQRLQIVRRFRWDYEDSVLNALKNIDPNTDEWSQASYVTSHPFLNYRMIRRFHVEIRQLYEHIWKNVEQELWQSLEKLRGDYDWPSLQDMTEVANLLIRLQQTYDFRLEQFTAGNFYGIQTGNTLTARHCLDLVEFSLNKGDTLAAGEWLKAARYKVMVSGDSSISLEDLTNYWQIVAKLHGKTWNIDDFNTPDIFHEARSIIRRDYEDQKFNKNFENRMNNFKALCRGENILLPSERSNLYCYLDFKKSPYFYINPQHVEVHSIDPEILEIHDFFGNSLAQDLVARSLQNLMLSNEYDTPKEFGFLNTKTTSPAWIYDQQHSQRIENIYSKIEHILGLNDKNTRYTSEPLHVTAFSVGGHYDPCVECEGWETEEMKTLLGPRTSSVQLMLETVGLGGETVFPLLGISIQSKKGSVLIFNNYLKTGNLDKRLLRGSCPVLTGHKCVVTKFIHTITSTPTPTN